MHIERMSAEDIWTGTDSIAVLTEAQVSYAENKDRNPYSVRQDIIKW